MKCPMCTAEIDENDIKCSYCGSVLKEETNIEPKEETILEEEKETEESKVEEVTPKEEEKEEKFIFCSNCGNKLAIDTKFCNKCGKKLKEEEGLFPKSEEEKRAEAFSKVKVSSGVSNVDNIKAYNKYNSNYNHAPKKSSGTALLIGVLLVMIIASVGGLLILAGGTSLLNFNKGKRTIMIYMVGSDLESKYGAASMDISEMLNANYDMDNVDVLIFTGGAKAWQTSDISNLDNGIYHVGPEGLEKLTSYEKTNMGDANTLTKFLNYAYDNYSAEKYGLIFWDHGGGPIYGYGLDEFSRTDMLTIKEIDSSIANSRFGYDKLDFIGFDACLMSSIEVANSVSNHADYLISSEETEPGFGWDYDFLNRINTTSNGKNIGIAIADTYEEFYRDIKVNGITISVMDLSKVKNVETEMNNLFKSLNGNLGSDFYTISRTRSNTKDFGRSASGSYDLIDLYDFADKLPDKYSSEKTRLKNAISSLIVYEKSDIKGANGVSTYFPYSNRKKISKSISVYNTFGFANNYLAFVSNFASKLTGEKIDTYNFKDVQPVAKNDGLIEVEVPQQVIDSYSKVTYRIFEKTKDGNYVPRYQGTDYEIDGNKISTTITKKGITATDKEGNSIYLMAFEAERGKTSEDGKTTYIKYLIPGTIEEITDEGIKIRTVFVHFVVSDENPNGKIEGVTETEPDVDLASKTIIDIDKVSKVLFLGTAEYKIFDKKGNYLSNWESVTTSKMEMIEESLEDVKIEFGDLNPNKDYYCIFEIQDSQGNSYSTKLVKVKK